MNGDVVASVLFLMIWLLPVFVRELRSSIGVLLVYWFVIALHQVVAFINAFLFTTLGADADASTFHRNGMALAEAEEFSFAIGSVFYENMLGVLYWVFGSSHLLGEQLSILAFSISCIVLIKILRLLGLLRYRISILLAFGALPTMVLLGAITLRESYQVLFFMLAVYFGIKMHLRGGINSSFIGLVLSAFAMGLFHKGLVVYAIFLVILFLLFSTRPTSHLWRIKKLRLMLLVILPVFAVLVFVVVKLQISGLSALTALTNMDLLVAVSHYREHAVVARATYGVELDLSSFVAFIFSALILYFHYLFSPFPWQVASLLDVYAVLESLLRAILLYYSVKHWRHASGVQRRLMGLMLILFLSMSLLWAMGTTNYGTAMRHHMLTWWILVGMGLPPLMAVLRHLLLGVIGNRPPFVAVVEKKN